MNGRLYVIGGIDPSTGQSTLNTVQSLDATQTPLSSTLYQHTGLNQSRCRFAIASWNGQIFVFGGDYYVPTPSPLGITVPGYAPTATIEAYTP
jgi:hypothetical protein